MKTVFLFPGQGSQKAGMLQELPINDPDVAEIFSLTEKVLGVPVYTLDTEERLTSTVYVQLCLLIIGVISAKRLMGKGVKADYVAGHSVGAFAAAVVADVIPFEQALKLVHTRGMLMEQAYPKGYGMAAVVGFSAARLQSYIQEHNAAHTTVYLSNINTADQQVMAGAVESLNILIQTLQKSGVRKAQLLNMSVPSHCPLLAGVAAALAAQIAPLTLLEPRIPYASNDTGRLLKTAEAIGTDLWKSVAATVRWYDATTLLFELGARIFIEVAPSGVLAKMAISTFQEAKVLALEETNIDAIAWLWNNYQTEQN